MAQLINALSHWVLHAFALHRYPILFFLVLIEEAGVPIPIPGDSLVMIAGGQAHKTLLYSFVIIALSSLAVFLGSSILYFVSRRGGRALLARYGKFMRLHPHRLERMEQWFQRRGPPVIVFGRLIPGLRVPTTIMSGLSDISYRVYAPTAAVAAVIWSLFYFFIGAAIRREWGVVTGVISGLLDVTSDYLVVIWVLLIALSIGFGGWHVTQRVRRRRLRNHLHLPHHHPQRPSADALSEADGRGR